MILEAHWNELKLQLINTVKSAHTITEKYLEKHILTLLLSEMNGSTDT